jgi:DNA polymerase-3 subunit alpha
MDLHGNIELMLFSDHLEELRRDFDLEKPIAFKVKIGRDGDFTRMNILKIETLEEARKEKVKVKREKRETPEAENLPPLILSLELISDPSVIEELYCLAERCPGRRPLQIEIRSKLADVVIESRMFVGEDIVKEAATLGVRVANYEEAS